jgi:hypothetical protein
LKTTRGNQSSNQFERKGKSTPAAGVNNFRLSDLLALADNIRLGVCTCLTKLVRLFRIQACSGDSLLCFLSSFPKRFLVAGLGVRNQDCFCLKPQRG